MRHWPKFTVGEGFHLNNAPKLQVNKLGRIVWVRKQLQVQVHGERSMRVGGMHPYTNAGLTLTKGLTIHVNVYGAWSAIFQ
jgi:hypothetical protein